MNPALWSCLWKLSVVCDSVVQHVYLLVFEFFWLSCLLSSLFSVSSVFICCRTQQYLQPYVQLVYIQFVHLPLSEKCQFHQYLNITHYYTKSDTSMTTVMRLWYYEAKIRKNNKPAVAGNFKARAPDHIHHQCFTTQLWQPDNPISPNNSPCVLHKWQWTIQFSSHSVSAARILLGVNHKLFSIRTCCLRYFEARSPGFNSWQLSTSHFPLFLLHNTKSYLSPAEARCFVTTIDIPIEALTWFVFTLHLHFQYCTLSSGFWFCELICAT